MIVQGALAWEIVAHVCMFDWGVQGYTLVTSHHWNEIDSVDAVFSLNGGTSENHDESQSAHAAFVFSGQQYFMFHNQALMTTARSIRVDWGIDGPIDAAFVWTTNGNVYLFSGKPRPWH